MILQTQCTAVCHQRYSTGLQLSTDLVCVCCHLNHVPCNSLSSQCAFGKRVDHSVASVRCAFSIAFLIRIGCDI